MTYCIAVFRSRSQAIDCRRALAGAGINASVISTPSAAGAGCGLSVKFACRAFKKAQAVIAKQNYPSFYGYLRG